MLSSKGAELIALLGRCRVGKPFLIRYYFQKYLAFEYTGIHETEDRSICCWTGLNTANAQSIIIGIVSD
jgi:hypothetical protein